MKTSLLLSGAVAPFLALGQEIIPAPVVPANTTTVAVLPDTTALLPETTAINTPSSSILFTSSVAPIVDTSSTEIAIESSTSDTSVGTPTSEVIIIEPTTTATTESSVLIPTSDSTTLLVPTTLTSATLSDTTTSEAIIETTTTATTETTAETTTAATTESSVSIASSDSTTLPELTSETSAVEEPTSVTVTEAPTQTEDVTPVQTDEAKKAADDAYTLMGIYVNNPTQENAQKAKDSTDNALGLVTGIGGGVAGFGGLISSLGGAASSLANAVSTPGAATAAAVSSAMTQVKEDIEETEKDDDDNKTTEENEPSSTEDNASSTTAESTTTTEESTTTTETTTTTTSEYPSPTFFYDIVTEAAGGSDDIASALAESQVPELGCMSEFVLPITACALQTGGGLDVTSTTATSAETTTATSEGSTTVTSIESTSAPSTLLTVTRSTDLTSDSTTTTIESSETLSSETTATAETLTTTTGSETTTDSSQTVPSTTTAESTTATTSEAPERTYYPCVNHGGPNVATPYCQCSTTTGGQTFFATATLISGQCAEYSTFPSEIPTVTTAVQPPVTQGPIAEPVTLTENGIVLSYPSRVYSYGEVYTGIEVTMTYGAGTPVTLSTPVPTQTDANNKGSSQCHSVDDACQRAYEQFEDDTIYTDYVSRYSRIKSGIIVAATFGQAGCTAQFKCDDYGIGMSGRLIKDAVAYMKENNGVSKCGTAYLSNSCSITLNYCTNCHHDG